MLTRRTRLRLAFATLLTGVLATTGVMLIRGPDAFAAPPNCENTPDSVECGIGGGIGGTNPGNGGGNPGGGGGGGGTCTWKGAEVACYIEGAGSFNANDGCYYRVQTPQPVGVPEGMTQYVRACIDTGGLQESLPLANPPDLFVPDPAEIAAQILATISFPRPQIELAPANSGVLGLPVWMRISNAAGWQEVTKTATITGLTVSVTATPSRAEWVMGDGNTVVCRARGNQWTSGSGSSPSPTCGYPMTGNNLAGYRAAGTYAISVSTFWEVAWVAGAENGVLPGVQSPVNQANYIVNELQVVNR
ncbi:hypothetical protein ACIA8K_10825 [Catenuloplanes sp. NPDC051500]|uniref:hypothetical protein n=1 Tax=Catenuloplanes sp. NPDC051500 TaxID=3363959 RepID=UPI0037B10BF6